MLLKSLGRIPRVVPGVPVAGKLPVTVSLPRSRLLRGPVGQKHVSGQQWLSDSSYLKLANISH